MKNDKTLIPPIGKMIIEIKGQRSFRDFEVDCDVSKGSLCRYINGTLDPSLKNLWKLSRPSSNPQANITFEELAKVAGFNQNEVQDCLSKMKYEYGKRETMYACKAKSCYEYGANSRIEDSMIENSIFKYVACQEGMTVNERNSTSADLFVDIVVDVDRKDTDIKKWLFDIQVCKNDTFAQLFKNELCRFILYESRKDLKITTVVDNRKYFEFIKRKAGRLSYKGNYTIMYYDKDSREIGEETIISIY